MLDLGLRLSRSAKLIRQYTIRTSIYYIGQANAFMGAHKKLSTVYSYNVNKTILLQNRNEHQNATCCYVYHYNTWNYSLLSYSCPYSDGLKIKYLYRTHYPGLSFMTPPSSEMVCCWLIEHSEEGTM